MIRKILLLNLIVGCLVTSLSAQESVDNDSPSASQPNTPHEDLDALLWMQTSAEYEAITLQTFRLAKQCMCRALCNPTWTACIEQQNMFADLPSKLAALPPAIIVDIDETVLDNSIYQTRLIKNEMEYDPETWTAFVNEAISTAVPGSTQLIQACRQAHIQVLFVTNRDHEVEQVTRRNLIKAGLMHEDDPDILFTKNERPEWTSDKKSRRVHLAQRYRILMIMGDDLNDFVSIGRNPKPGQRKSLASQHADWWGVRWMMLPNANYGGWERSLYDWNDVVPREKKLMLKRQQMRN